MRSPPTVRRPQSRGTDFLQQRLLELGELTNAGNSFYGMGGQRLTEEHNPRIEVAASADLEQAGLVLLPPRI